MKTQLLILVFFTLLSCSKKDTPTLTPLEQLPPLTHRGANTAGCLVNGEAFLPKGYFPSGNLTCYYINQTIFSLSISEKKNNIIKSTYIYTNLQHLGINKVYFLNKRRISNSNFGEFEILPSSGNDEIFSTTPTVTGELVITHHNYNEAIISGTFWYDAIDSTGEKVEIREGRFDMKY